MSCPACGSRLKQQTTKKGVLFLVCSKWPTCNVACTPALLELLKAPPRYDAQDPRILGKVSYPLSQLRILQSQYRAANEEERKSIREQAREVIREDCE